MISSSSSRKLNYQTRWYETLSQTLNIKELKTRRKLLWIHLERKKGSSVAKKQFDLIAKLLQSPGITNSMPVGSWLQPSRFVDKEFQISVCYDQYSSHSRAMGRLMHHGTQMRPNLGIGASVLRPHILTPIKVRISCAERTSPYLRGTRDKWQAYKPGLNNQLQTYAFVSCGNELEGTATADRRSWHCMDKWPYRKRATYNFLSSWAQQKVSMSRSLTWEKSISWLQQVLNEVVVEEEPAWAYQVSVGCIKWATLPTVRHISRRNHIDIARNRIMSSINHTMIEAQFCETPTWSRTISSRSWNPSDVCKVLERAGSLQ